MLTHETSTGDDICGLSITTRFTSNLISIWNRRGDAQKSIDGIMKTILEELPTHLQPKESSYYYKKHSEHAGFAEVVAAAKKKDESEQKKRDWQAFAVEEPKRMVEMEQKKIAELEEKRAREELGAKRD